MLLGLRVRDLVKILLSCDCFETLQLYVYVYVKHSIIETWPYFHHFPQLVLSLEDLITTLTPRVYETV